MERITTTSLTIIEQQELFSETLKAMAVPQQFNAAIKAINNLIWTLNSNGIIEYKSGILNDVMNNVPEDWDLNTQIRRVYNSARFEVQILDQQISLAKVEFKSITGSYNPPGEPSYLLTKIAQYKMRYAGEAASIAANRGA